MRDNQTLFLCLFAKWLNTFRGRETERERLTGGKEFLKLVRMGSGILRWNSRKQHFRERSVLGDGSGNTCKDGRDPEMADVHKDGLTSSGWNMAQAHHIIHSCQFKQNARLCKVS